MDSALPDDSVAGWIQRASEMEVNLRGKLGESRS